MVAAKHEKQDPASNRFERLDEEEEVGSARASFGGKKGAGEMKGKDNHAGVPRWRQIEIMRERQALKAMLDDFGDEELQLDEDIFGSERERQVYYRSLDDQEVEEEEIEVALEEESYDEEVEEE